jgi:hypothetical protein
MDSDATDPFRGSSALPDEDAFSPDGVDLSLIRWMLSLTPAERLRVLQQHIDSVTRLRRAQTRR